jgi:anti-sigma factor RsiW
MNTPAEPDLHAYVDGLLEPERRRAVEDWLAAHPERAAELRSWQRDARQLRAALGRFDDAAATPWLDPARIRARLRARRRTRVAMAAAVALSVVIGALGGWHMHASSDAVGQPPMADALEAYRMFASEAALHPDVTPRDLVDMQVWLDRQFASAPRLPDLAPAGFHPVGARLLSTAEGPAAMVLYDDGQQGAISFYVRPRAPVPRGERREGALIAQYGSVDHYSIAMVSRADGRDATIARRAIADSL